MPWSPDDAPRHTKKANTAKKRRAFAHAANSVLAQTGDDGRAVRAGNAVVAQMSGEYSADEERAMRHRRRGAR